MSEKAVKMSEKAVKKSGNWIIRLEWFLHTVSCSTFTSCIFNNWLEITARKLILASKFSACFLVSIEIGP